jgi:hypothetical protein
MVINTVETIDETRLRAGVNVNGEKWMAGY